MKKKFEKNWRSSIDLLGLERVPSLHYLTGFAGGRAGEFPRGNKVKLITYLNSVKLPLEIQSTSYYANAKTGTKDRS
jgi:hypothetical protein